MKLFVDDSSQLLENVPVYIDVAARESCLHMSISQQANIRVANCRNVNTQDFTMRSVWSIHKLPRRGMLNDSRLNGHATRDVRTHTEQMLDKAYSTYDILCWTACMLRLLHWSD